MAGGMGHSNAMSAGGRNIRGSRRTVAKAHHREDLLSCDFVQLSQLRKLRDCEQVAAVCYRVVGGDIEFLLVRTRSSRRWTFPKGSAERGLTHAQAAALEAFEEAGVHGRIEEEPFAGYTRRRKPGNDRKTARSAEIQFAVNAHLCEVLRLGAPKESGRDRTWFSLPDAKQRLRENRNHQEGAQFVRVIDKAAARIQNRKEAGGQSAMQRVQGRQALQPVSSRPDSLRPDSLRKVDFDFAEAYGRTAWMPYVQRQLKQTRQPAVEAESRILRSEVLEFQRHRDLRGSRWLSVRSKLKALGNGTQSD